MAIAALSAIKISFLIGPVSTKKPDAIAQNITSPPPLSKNWQPDDSNSAKPYSRAYSAQNKNISWTKRKVHPMLEIYSEKAKISPNINATKVS